MHHFSIGKVSGATDQLDGERGKKRLPRYVKPSGRL